MARDWRSRPAVPKGSSGPCTVYTAEATATGPTLERHLPAHAADAGILFAHVQVSGPDDDDGNPPAAEVAVEGRTGPDAEWEELERFGRGLRFADARQWMRFRVLSLTEGATVKVALAA